MVLEHNCTWALCTKTYNLKSIWSLIIRTLRVPTTCNSFTTLNKTGFIKLFVEFEVSDSLVSNLKKKTRTLMPKAPYPFQYTETKEEPSWILQVNVFVRHLPSNSDSPTCSWCLPSTSGCAAGLESGFAGVGLWSSLLLLLLGPGCCCCWDLAAAAAEAAAGAYGPASPWSAASSQLSALLSPSPPWACSSHSLGLRLVPNICAEKIRRFLLCSLSRIHNRSSGSNLANS